jgi:hypothetical protein
MIKNRFNFSIFGFLFIDVDDAVKTSIWFRLFCSQFENFFLSLFFVGKLAKYFALGKAKYKNVLIAALLLQYCKFVVK